MPVYKSPFDRGNLYIKFHVAFPENHFADAETLRVMDLFIYFFPVMYINGL